MGWADCGDDSKGRPIGYGHDATCDHPGCTEEIDRGLGWACGDMHGDHDWDCKGYFCSDHATYRYSPDEERGARLCLPCATKLDETKAEDFLDNLQAVLTSLSEHASEDEMRNAIVKTKQMLYDVLLRWDEIDDLPPDPRYAKGADLEKLQQRQRWNDE